MSDAIQQLLASRSASPAGEKAKADPQAGLSGDAAAAAAADAAKS
jgi:hypothetical protein